MSNNTVMKNETRVYVVNKYLYHGVKSLYHCTDEQFIEIAETQDNKLEGQHVPCGVFTLDGFMNEFRKLGLKPMPLPHVETDLIRDCVIRFINVPSFGDDSPPLKYNDINPNYIDKAMEAVALCLAVSKKDENDLDGKSEQEWTDVLNHLGVIKLRAYDTSK